MAKRIVNVNLMLEINDDDAAILDGEADDSYWDYEDIINSAWRNGNATLIPGNCYVYYENGFLIREIN